MSNNEKTEYEKVLHDFEAMTAYYEEKLQKLKAKSIKKKIAANVMRQTKVLAPTTRASTGGFYRDIQTDHKLTANKAEKIRHRDRITLDNIIQPPRS